MNALTILFEADMIVGIVLCAAFVFAVFLAVLAVLITDGSEVSDGCS